MTRAVGAYLDMYLFTDCGVGEWAHLVFTLFSVKYKLQPSQGRMRVYATRSNYKA